jgi:hypothetical protein
MLSILGFAGQLTRVTHPERRGPQNGLLAVAMCQDIANHFGLDLDITRDLLAQHAASGHASTLTGWRMAADMLASAGMDGGPYEPVIH